MFGKLRFWHWADTYYLAITNEVTASSPFAHLLSALFALCGPNACVRCMARAPSSFVIDNKHTTVTIWMYLCCYCVDGWANHNSPHISAITIATMPYAPSSMKRFYMVLFCFSSFLINTFPSVSPRSGYVRLTGLCTTCIYIYIYIWWVPHEKWFYPCKFDCVNSLQETEHSALITKTTHRTEWERKKKRRRKKQEVIDSASFSPKKNCARKCVIFSLSAYKVLKKFMSISFLFSFLLLWAMTPSRSFSFSL